MNVIIPYSEIHEILNGSYIDDGEEILTKGMENHNKTGSEIFSFIHGKKHT